MYMCIHTHMHTCIYFHTHIHMQRIMGRCHITGLEGERKTISPEIR